MNAKYLILSIFLIFSLSACSTQQSRFAAISSSPLSLYTMTADNPIIVKNARAQISRGALFTYPQDYMPVLDDAIEQILLDNRGDYLTNVRVSHTTVNFLFLYHYSSWKVKADVNRVLR